MANEIPQLQETQPVLQAQHVSSKAEGYDAFAQTLGHIAGAGAKVAATIAEEKSNSMYLSSVANIDQLKLSTQELILTDPANASKHVETMRDSIDKVKQIAYVNRGDRSKLNQYANHSLNSTELDAVQATVKQAQIGAAYEHYSNWPAQLNALGEASLTDEKEFDKLKDSMLAHIKELVMSGSLTPIQGGNAIKSMSDRIDLAKDAHDILNNAEKHTAQNYHTAMSNPLEPNKTTNLNYPVDENTNWLVNYHASDRSFQGARDSIQGHMLPDMKAIENMTSHQRNQIKQEINGVRAADGIINSNSSLPKVMSRINDLEGRTDYQSLSEKKNLKQYVNDLKNGNSQRLMARTTIGGRIVRDYTDNQAYLDNKLIHTDPKNIKEINNIKSDIAKNKNTYVNNSIGYAEGHHWPIVHPIPKEDVAVVQNGFNVAGNPAENASNAYSTYSQYSKENQMYFADQMKNPRHKVVLQTITLNGTENTQGEHIDFIAANQNRTYREIDLKTEDQISDDYLKNSINTKITDAIKVIQSQNNPIDAVSLNGQLIMAGVNYAKFISEKNGQFSMKDGSVFNSIDNVNSVTDFINRSYKPLSGANYIINQKQNDIDKVQMDAISQYAINEGNAYLKQHMSTAQFIALQNQAPLTVTITPTNHVIAKNGLGNIAFSSALTSDLIAHADAKMKKAKEEKVKEEKKLFEKVKERSFFLSPEEQFMKLNIGEGNVD